VRSAFVSKRAPVDRLVQIEAIKLFPGWSKVVGAPLALYEQRPWISDLAPEGDLTPEPRNVQRRRFDVTRMPRRKAIFGVLSWTVLWTGLTLVSESSRSVSTCRSRSTPDGLYSLFRERLCSVDVRIPGPNVVRGKGVDTHAIDLGGLRTCGHASD